MKFPTLKEAWAHVRRAKKQVTVAKNNAKVAIATYNGVKTAAKNNAKVAIATYNGVKKANSPVKSALSSSSRSPRNYYASSPRRKVKFNGPLTNLAVYIRKNGTPNRMNIINLENLPKYYNKVNTKHGVGVYRLK
jgi:hypothetical protein